MDTEPSGRDRDGRAVELRRLLRNSHIFSSTISEIIEDRFLHDRGHAQLSRCQLRTLRFVVAYGELRIGDVARCLGISAAAASKTIGRLEELGLIDRKSVPEDRRATLLSASPDGRQIVAGYDDFAASLVAPLNDSLGAAQLEQLGNLLEHFSLHLLEHYQGDGGACLRCAGFYEEDCPINEQQPGCSFQQGSESTGSTTQAEPEQRKTRGIEATRPEHRAGTEGEVGSV